MRLRRAHADGPAAGDLRGSALILVPAGVLVVLILASIAVDLAIVQLRQRQAFDLAASAANDAATAGADPEALRAGQFRLDRARASAVIDRSILASELAPELASPPVVTVAPASVEVTISLHADYLFAAALPGAPSGTTVTATAAATAEPPAPGS